MAVESIPSLIPILGPPDYRDWIRQASVGLDEEKDAYFQRNIVPHLNDYAEGGLFSRFQQDHPWLTDFQNPSSNFEHSLRQLRQQPNDTTITLADYVKHLAGTIITVAWQENMTYFVRRVE